MKRGKIILGLSCLIIVTICTINVQNSFITAKKAGYSRLIDIITLNVAKADYPKPSCDGSDCADANGYKYNTLGVGEKTVCCGIADDERGKQAS